MSGYSDDELKLIGGWLVDGLSAAKIAEQLSIHRHAFVSRNGIIGIVHRDPSLKKIGFERQGTGHDGGRPAGPKAARRSATAKTPKQNLHAGNIRGKKEGRKNDPGFVAERIKPPAAEAMAYDLGSRRVELTELGRFDCRFAVNDAATGEPHLFCGGATEAGSPYCRHHAMRAFNGRVTLGAKPFTPKRMAAIASFGSPFASAQ